jgi:hypothetical protein
MRNKIQITIIIMLTIILGNILLSAKKQSEKIDIEQIKQTKIVENKEVKAEKVNIQPEQKEAPKKVLKTVKKWADEGTYESTVQQHEQYKVSYEYQQKGQPFIEETIWSVFIVDGTSKTAVFAKSVPELLKKVNELPSQFDFVKGE